MCEVNGVTGATLEGMAAITVKKRTGEVVPFSREKIINAVFKAAKSVGGTDLDEAGRLADKVVEALLKLAGSSGPLDVETIQDTVEKVLIEQGHAKTAKSYILYREKHKEERELKALQRLAEDEVELDDPVSRKLLQMFSFESKLAKVVGKDLLNDYRTLSLRLRKLQAAGELQLHPKDSYLGGSDLAKNIYQKKYYLKDLDGQPIEERPEDTFARIASFIAAIEPTEKKQLAWAKAFYEALYEGYFIPGGRVIAGAGDLYRLKTLANCFVTLIKGDNIESIYNSAYDCARTYSFGGGIGTDISVLRPRDAVVHNAADKSTGAVSFMELFSLTTGLIGQSGRRGALMLTIDVKHPDVVDFMRVKQNSNWVTKQIVEQCRWSNQFSDVQLEEIERQVRENTQVRFANISVKISDEFMQAVEEQNRHGKDAILLYLKDKDVDNGPQLQGGDRNYSFGMPAKPIGKYKLVKAFRSIEELNKHLKDNYGQLAPVTEEMLGSTSSRDVFGDYVIKGADQDFAVRRAGDFMLYYYAKQTGEIKRLVKARDIWNTFVEGNYRTAEPGLIFWSRMSGYSPSNYVGRPISSTNPCGEVPLESGGACNLASVNLSRFVLDGYTDLAQLDLERLGEMVHTTVRFLDNVVSWNERLNPLEDQRDAATLTRRLGLGVVGIADMLNQLGLGYDSDEGIALIEKVMRFIANKAYEASALLAEEKGASPLFSYDAYSRGPFFAEALSEETKDLIREKGLRNIAILAIAPTGTISNIVLGFRNGETHYVGVSGGVEPIFALYYTRRSESFGNMFFKVFHSTVQAYLDMNGLTEQAKSADEEKLRELIPEHFFRTAHHIVPEQRVRVQSVCQRFVDQSISSTVNLPEDIEPETISQIYLNAWKHHLKGITIYREGSRYPILQSEEKKTEFHGYKEKTFKLKGADGSTYEGTGDTVITLPSGKLSTIYHVIKEQGGNQQ